MYLHDKCSYRRAEEVEKEEVIKRQSSACSQYLPSHTDAWMRQIIFNVGRMYVLNTGAI